MVKVTVGQGYFNPFAAGTVYIRVQACFRSKFDKIVFNTVFSDV